MKNNNSERNQKKRMQEIAGINEPNVYDLASFIKNWAEENGSAVDMWGWEQDWQEIKDAVESGVKLKIVTSVKALEKYTDAGWEELTSDPFGTEDAFEAILYKAG